MKKSDIFLLFFIRAKRSKAGVGQETGARVSYSTLQRYPSQVQAQCLPSSSTKSIHPMLHKPTLFFFFLTNWSKHGNTSKWLPVHPIIKKKLILNWASLVACFKMQSITPKLCEHDHQKRRTCSTSRAFAATGVAFLQGHFNVIETASTESCAIAFLLHLLTNFRFQLNSSFSVKWPSSYWRQYHCYSVIGCAAQKQKTNKLQINTEFQVSPPTGFSHLRHDQSGYHLLIPTPIHWHSHNSLPWLTIWEKDLVNLSKHSLLSLPKHGAEANGNYCIQCWCMAARVPASGCVHN